MTTTLTKNDLVLQAARGERTQRTPVWLMRQAGRFDPEYRALRDRCGLYLEDMFRDPDLAAEVTLLPGRFGVDALILFQDILTPCAPMGAPFLFRPGPALEQPIRSRTAIESLRRFDVRDALHFVPETIHRVLRELHGEMPLLGFAGAPLTVAAFMVAGASPGRDLEALRILIREDPAAVHELLSLLTETTVEYLAMQIDAGVEAVQLFESVGDVLTEDEYRTFAYPYHAAIFRGLGERVPRILFVKERNELDLMSQCGADVLSLGARVDLARARREYGDRVALQGNVDNRLLRDGTEREIVEAVQACVRAGGHHGHILNLNHGLFKNTPFDNVRLLIETCHATRVEQD